MSDFYSVNQKVLLQTLIRFYSTADLTQSLTDILPKSCECYLSIWINQWNLIQFHQAIPCTVIAYYIIYICISYSNPLSHCFGEKFVIPAIVWASILQASLYPGKKWWKNGSQGVARKNSSYTRTNGKFPL